MPTLLMNQSERKGRDSTWIENMQQEDFIKAQIVHEHELLYNKYRKSVSTLRFIRN